LDQKALAILLPEEREEVNREEVDSAYILIGKLDVGYGELDK
jgi:hypothetical protein